MSDWSRSWSGLADASAEEVLSAAISEWHRWLILERRFNNGSPSGFTNSTSAATSPAMLAASYRLPSVTVPFEEAVLVGGEGNNRFISSYGNDRPFPVHPDHLIMDSELCANGHIGEVSPTASGRTVALVDGGADHLFIKLHYPGVVGRFQRDLPLYKWLHALTLDRICAGIAHEGLAIMGESVGGYWERPRRAGWGYLVRSTAEIPRDATVIPLFSYLWRDGDGRYPVAESVLESYQLSPANLGTQLVEVYFYLALEYGLLPECNSQNILLEFHDGAIRVVFRDLNDFFVDGALRLEIGLLTPTVVYKQIDNASPDLKLRRSFSFDFKLGNYVLNPLSVVANEVCGTSFDVFTDKIMAVSREHAREGYFPSSVYGYPISEHVDRNSYVDMGRPRFR